MENISIFHNSQDLSYRKPFGAVLCGSKIFLRIDVKECEEVNLELIHFDYSRETIKMVRKNIISFIAELKLEKIGVINYYFSIKKNNCWVYYGNNEEGLGGIGKTYDTNPIYFQITVYEDFQVPSWYKEGIMYQIFVDSFNRENTDSQLLNIKKNGFIYSDWYDEPMYVKDKEGNILRWAFYGGNLEGVIRKLPYFKELGVTCIYLNPIFEATSVHKYDTANYLKIDPMLGDEEKFKELCEKAMKANIRVVLDGVFSHTGDDSVYFNKYGNYTNLGAYESKTSPYFSWYRFKTFPSDYECWWGVKALPNVNELEPSYMDFIINSEHSVLTKWVKLGASGWRLDVADELPDEFIESFKCKLKETNKEAVLIGEVWEDASNKISYDFRRKYLLGKELDSVMNYPFRNLVIDFFRGYIDSIYFNRKVMSLYENYPQEVFYANMNLIGTHDTERLFTLYLNHSHCENTAVNFVKLSALLQFTFPGVPCIYYGDEAGLTGGKDPNNRKAYPWNRENLELIRWYKKICKLRIDYKVFKKGAFKMYYINEDIICFERSYEKEKGIVILNRSSSKSYEVSLKEISITNYFEVQLIESKENCKEIDDITKIKIKALEGRVLICNLE